MAATDCDSASYSRNLWRRFPIMELWRGTKMYWSNEAHKVPIPKKEEGVTSAGKVLKMPFGMKSVGPWRGGWRS